MAQGVDSLAERKAEKTEEKAELAANFKRLAWEWFENTANARKWGDKHRKKIKQQLERHILPTFGGIDCREIRPKEITEFIQSLNVQGINTTAHDCFDIMRRIFAYAVQMEIRETSPAAHLKDITPNTPADQ
ncbi:phage integrase central domain-containing protein [Suttonella ornithocola]|uniref:tyrosine-type recombinase/integrase n=1 Tax=Suttonella ornithocola TaxID=279832 RepID=UPI0009FF212A